MSVLDEQRDLLTGPLSTAMRAGSRREHQEAEESHFIVALLAGRVDEAGYTGYLERLRTVYATLERVGRSHLHDPLVAAVVDPGLERLDALEADIAFWSAAAGDAGLASAPVDSPVADDYARRLESTSAWGGLYVAHHYTRYLGDLSGGQAIGRILSREFDLGPHGAGVAFYAFPQVPKPKPYKDAYRARLDAFALGTEEKRLVVSEVQAAFRLNQALFAELDTTLVHHRRTPRPD